MSDKREMTICMWPGQLAGNKIIELFCSGLSAHGARIAGVEYPRLRGKYEYDILLIHWPELLISNEKNVFAAFRNVVLALLAFLRMRLCKVKIVWMVHNLSPHDIKGLKALLWQPYSFLLKYIVDGFVTLSPSTLATLRNEWFAFRIKPSAYIWHPRYTMPVEISSSRAKLIEHFGITRPGHLIGYFGLIRPYKGIEDLMTIFNEAKIPDCDLIISGHPLDIEYADRLRKLASGNQHVHLEFRHLSEEEYNMRVAGVNIFCAPYHRYLHSGSLIHALSAGTRVLTPGTPFASDLRDLLGESWVQTYAGELTPAHLKAALDLPGDQERPDLSTLSPERVTADLIKFFRTVMSA
jgi:beta-1,4-mannosyltransferase